MSVEDPFPAEQVRDGQFEALVADLCARPGMYLHPPSLDTVIAYIDGFNTARSGGPLRGLREWLVVRANGGNNLHWSGLACQLMAPAPDDPGRARALGQLLAEFLRYRYEAGITKVYYDYGRWLLRQRWYRGPLRKKHEELAEPSAAADPARHIASSDE